MFQNIILFGTVTKVFQRDQLKLIYELKLNGLEELIRNIKKKYAKP